MIIIWPKNKWINIICEGKVKDAVKYLDDLMAKCKRIKSRESPQWQTVIKMATILAKKFHSEPNTGLLDALLVVGDVNLVKHYLRNLSLFSRPKDPEQFYATLSKCVAKFGWKSLAEAINEFRARKCSIQDYLLQLTHGQISQWRMQLPS